MKRNLFRIALLILLCIFSACIVKPEYIAESALIPRQPTPSPALVNTADPGMVTDTPVQTEEPAAADTTRTGSDLPEGTGEPPASDPSYEAQAATDLESEENGYFYSFLTDDQKRIYREIRQVWENFESEHVMQTNGIEDYDIAYYSLIMDYAQYYYDSAYSVMYDDTGKIYINLKDDAQAQQYREELAMIREITDSIIASIPEDATEYETVRLFFIWLCENVSYEHSDRDQDIRSVFIDRKSVCNGYARAFQYLCSRVGIQCALAAGTADNAQTPPEEHAWDLVRIDGQYYWVDPTWGDPVLEDPAADGVINYYYLCTTDEFLSRTHTLEPFEVETGQSVYQVEYPKCTDESLLYSKQFGLFFDSYDEKLTGDAIIDYLKSGKGNDIILQFRNPKDASRFAEELLPNIFEKLWNSGLTSITSYHSPAYDERNGYIELVFK